MDRNLVVVTDQPQHETVTLLVQHLEQRQWTAHVLNRLLHPCAERVLFWGLEARHHQELSAEAKQAKVALLNPVRSSWVRMARRLRRAGLHVRRQHLVRRRKRAYAMASLLGYPLVVVRDNALLPPVTCASKAELRRNLAAGAVLYEGLAGAQTFRVTVVRGRPFVASDGDPPTAALLDLAVRTCRILKIHVATVELALDGDRPVVASVNPYSPKLDAASAEYLVGSLDRPRKRSRRARSSRRSSHARITVGITCHDPRWLRPTWLWCILPHFLRRRGNRVLTLGPDQGADALERCDFIICNPERTARNRERPVEFMNELYDRFRTRAHYAKRYENGSLVSVSTKPAAFRMANELGLLHPPTYMRTLPADVEFPLIAKPVAGTCGIGIAMIRNRTQLARFASRGRIRRGYVVQRWLANPTRTAVSLRLITVRTRVVASALFVRPGGVTSNVARGGHIIPLTGLHRDSRLGRAELSILSALGMPARDRSPPEEALRIVTAVSSYLSERGLQICGHDLIPTLDGRWAYLESNCYPGYLIFASTDGDMSRNYLHAYYRAGVLMSRAIEEVFAGAARASDSVSQRATVEASQASTSLSPPCAI